jgi:hypothetical protein
MTDTHSIAGSPTLRVQTDVRLSEVHSTPSLLSALPSATVVTIDTPSGLDKSQRTTLANSLAQLMTGHWFGASAATKAKDLVAMLPPSVATPEGLTNIQAALEQDRAGVDALLHFGSSQCGNAAGRTTARAALVGLLACAVSLEDAQREKANIVKMTPDQRLAYLRALVPLPAEEEAPSSGPSAMRQLESTTVGDANVFFDDHSGGTASQPMALDFVGSDTVAPRDMMRRALGTTTWDDGEGRVAFAGSTTLGATRSDFALSHSFSPCVPIVVFWKDAQDVQQATLFHFNGIVGRKHIERCLSAIDPNMRIDSFNFVERSPGRYPGKPKIQQDYKEILEGLARERGVPFNVIPSQARSMALAVDVQRAKIVTMDQSSLRGVGFPHTDRVLDGEMRTLVPSDDPPEPFDPWWTRS